MEIVSVLEIEKSTSVYSKLEVGIPTLDYKEMRLDVFNCTMYSLMHVRLRLLIGVPLLRYEPYRPILDLALVLIDCIHLELLTCHDAIPTN